MHTVPVERTENGQRIERDRQNNDSPAGRASSPFPIQSSSAQGKAAGNVGLEMIEVMAIKTTL